MNFPQYSTYGPVLLPRSVSRVAINRRASARIVERTQGHRRTGVQIRCTAEVVYNFIQLIFVSSRSARGPSAIDNRGDPIESTWGG